MSPLNKCSAVSSKGRIDSLMVTWYTDYLGLTLWSELGILKGWLPVITSDVFAFVPLAVLQCDQQAGTGLAIRSESLSPTRRKGYLDLTFKISNLTNLHFQMKKKKVPIKSTLARNLDIKSLGKGHISQELWRHDVKFFITVHSQYQWTL